MADSRAKHLAAGIEKAGAELKARRLATQELEERRIERLAVLLRADFELDERLRLLELEVLGAVEKNREEAGYRSVFPGGLSSLLALRGDDEARAVGAILPKLKERFPKIEVRHGGELERLAAACVKAENAWKESETNAWHAFAEEVIARTELVRQLQKTEGALVQIYPGERRRVRSYFRPTRRRGAAESDAAPEPTRADAPSPVG